MVPRRQYKNRTTRVAPVVSWVDVVVVVLVPPVVVIERTVLVDVIAAGLLVGLCCEKRCRP